MASFPRGRWGPILVGLLVLLVLLILAGPSCREGDLPPAVSVEGGLLLGADGAGTHVRALGPSVVVRLDWPSRVSSRPHRVEVSNVPDPEHVTVTLSVGGHAPQQQRVMVEGGTVCFTVEPVEEQVTEIVLSSPDPPLPFTFAVLGDSQGHEEALGTALERLASTEARFLVHLGDMVPAGEESQYRGFLETMKGWTRPYYTVPGNHDVRGEGTMFYQEELAPLRYSFTYGGYSFAFLDT